jgi:hypothetical protein
MLIRFLSNIALFALLLSISGCQTLVQERLREVAQHEVHKYSGSVLPLTETINLRHGPYPKTNFHGSIKFIAHKDNNLVGKFTAEMSGTIWSDRIENKNAITWQYDHVLITGKKRIEFNEPMYARALVSDYGKVSDVTWSGAEKFIELLSPDQQTSNQLESFVRDSIFSFPKSGLSQNQRLIFMNNSGLSMRGVVKGRVNHNGVSGILIETWIDSVSTNQSIPIGYTILSEDNGRIISSRVIAIIDNYKNQSGMSIRIEGASVF